MGPPRPPRFPGLPLLLAPALTFLAALAPPPSQAQVIPDPARVDTLEVVPPPWDIVVFDTLRIRVLPAGAGTLREAPDSPVVLDSLIYHTLPAIPGGAPPGRDRAIFVWDREDLLGSRALTLVELLSLAPGIVPVRGGDYGTPAAVTAFGLGAGRVRVFLDGFEMLPLDGGVPDLARIGLGGLQTVRLERGPGELRVELESYRVDDPRPLSLVEASTGDLRTNHFRATFVHPRALGGSLGLDLERLDTQGPRGAESGSLTGGWLRYTLHRGDAAGLRFEFRAQAAESGLDVYPGEVSRRDWTLRGRTRLAEGLVAGVFTGRSEVEGGTGDGLTPIDGSRAQHGVRIGLARGPLWARSTFRLLSGPDLPSSDLALEAGAGWPALGHVSARLDRQSWAGEATGFRSVTVSTGPVFGLSAFATWEDGTRGSRIFPAREPVPEPGDPEEPPEQPEPEPEPGVPTHRFTDRTGYRLGASARVGPLAVSAARLSFEADSLVPFGILLDREGVAVQGGRFTGLEAWARLRLPVEGFELEGSMQRWDEEARYLPKLLYGGGLHYHGLPMESDNLEIWGSVGVDGRDPMPVALPAAGGADPPVLQTVPFAQSWYGFLQIRIVTVRIFLRFENFTLRENNQDIPGRVLPLTRATYGVRWTFWN